MRKIFKTIVVASFAALAMPLTASTMQTYTASSDSIDTTVEPADTLREKLAQMETRMASMEQEQEMQKTWKRRKYWKIGITSPNLERTDGEEMKWKTNGSFFIQKGRTSYLHSKPIAGMIKFGIDYGFIDVTYSKLELKEISYSGESGTRASDGFDDIVSGDPDGDIGISELTGIDLGMHKIDYALHVGPSISVNPWNKLIATAYFHVMPTASSIIQNDNFSYGFGCMMAAGVSVAYKAISLGVEGEAYGARLSTLRPTLAAMRMRKKATILTTAKTKAPAYSTRRSSPSSRAASELTSPSDFKKTMADNATS